MGWKRKNLEKMLDAMGVTYPENATTRQLKWLFRHAPDKDLICLKGKKGRNNKNTDIFNKWKRQPGNYRG